MKKIYLDTSVISALFDTRTPERMDMTKKSWEQIQNCDVYISNIVNEELHMAKSSLYEKFDNIIKNFKILNVTNEVYKLAQIYVEHNIFPIKYFDDALHVVICAINNIEILISWNYKHLVKMKTKKLVSAINMIHEYSHVEIIAPPEL